MRGGIQTIDRVHSNPALTH